MFLWSTYTRFCMCVSYLVHIPLCQYVCCKHTTSPCEYHCRSQQMVTALIFGRHRLDQTPSSRCHLEKVWSSAMPCKAHSLPLQATLAVSLPSLISWIMPQSINTKTLHQEAMIMSADQANALFCRKLANAKAEFSWGRTHSSSLLIQKSNNTNLTTSLQQTLKHIHS